mmetsp:Transcript_10867/g.26829  ORF Transcript_10867/g.26829 Transcript_10867/m.26829 type:complete len:411 (-) Transcript_10867:412-1644(-)|eukprot:CAMPEP_0181104890 /NCGR_PEP_ID=MMETSP1071-20121207/15674_1 /TAXON_ID=35127 /ORGANISM="Thalassiosira sp., Strain NH16" /LENGTH=410 /DNA_ID=CAMNT_0023188129 /DNA_START=48 /DNA_END=1280 /DNA_ORIENTATION=+
MSCSVAVVDVGTRPRNFRRWHKAEVHFHGFAALSTGRRDFVASSDFTCLGHKWRLVLYPGGSPVSDAGMIGLYLINMSNKGIKINYGFGVKDSDGRYTAHKNTESANFPAHGVEDEDEAWALFGDVTKRSTILKSLVNGSLVIEVQMRLAGLAQMIPPPFVPENPACNCLRKMFMEEESADIVFEFHQKGGNQKKKAKDRSPRKKAKTSPAMFYAHRIILQKCAPQLAEMCGPMENATSPVSVSIPDVTPEIFHHILRYIYGGEIDGDDLEANARDIIDAADKYGVFNLKLKAEACLVKTTAISVENVMDLLLYADSKNCALLKEAVMDFIVQNEVDVINKVSFKDIPGETVKDVLAAMARGKNKSGENSTCEDHLCTMRITELRKRVHKKGLEVDGSRDMLIAALKESF